MAVAIIVPPRRRIGLPHPLKFLHALSINWRGCGSQIGVAVIFIHGYAALCGVAGILLQDGSLPAPKLSIIIEASVVVIVWIPELQSAPVAVVCASK